VVNGYDTALQTAKQLINGDPTECVTCRNMGGDSFQVWAKEAKKTNSSKGSVHTKTFGIFYGAPADFYPITYILVGYLAILDISNKFFCYAIDNYEVMLNFNYHFTYYFR
jgi:hypothetical protein